MSSPWWVQPRSRCTRTGHTRAPKRTSLVEPVEQKEAKATKRNSADGAIPTLWASFASVHPRLLKPLPHLAGPEFLLPVDLRQRRPPHDFCGITGDVVEEELQLDNVAHCIPRLLVIPREALAYGRAEIVEEPYAGRFAISSCSARSGRSLT